MVWFKPSLSPVCSGCGVDWDATYVVHFAGLVFASLKQEGFFPSPSLDNVPGILLLAFWFVFFPLTVLALFFFFFSPSRKLVGGCLNPRPQRS